MPFSTCLFYMPFLHALFKAKRGTTKNVAGLLQTEGSMLDPNNLLRLAMPKVIGSAKAHPTVDIDKSKPPCCETC